MTYFQQNREKLEELDSDVRYAGFRFLEECEKLGYIFLISEVYRTPERQLELYKIGRRGKLGERPVTWTLFSEHQQRLAMDLYPKNCSHRQLEEVAKKYGITHPWPINDPPHYSLISVPLYEPIFFPTIDARIRGLTRRISRVTGITKIMLQNQLNRLLKRQ